METITITDEQVALLTQEFKRDYAPPAALSIDLSSKFCELWPTAKNVLEFLQQTVGKNPVVALAIKAVMVAGDAYFAAFCKKS